MRRDENVALDTEKLTPEQFAFLKVLSAGLTTREMSARLCVTASTVRYHLDNLRFMAGIEPGGGTVRAKIIAHFCDVTIKNEYHK